VAVVSLDSALARGRAAAERMMVDSCTIRRRTGESTAPDGNVTPTYLSPDPYTGRCRVQQRTAAATPADAGEAYALMLSLEVQVPMSVVGVQADDEVTITASVDPDLVGRTFLVRALAHATHKTARRLQVVERTS
jgi:hypothetical protein